MWRVIDTSFHDERCCTATRLIDGWILRGLGSFSTVSTLRFTGDAALATPSRGSAYAGNSCACSVSRHNTNSARLTVSNKLTGNVIAKSQGTPFSNTAAYSSFGSTKIGTTSPVEYFAKARRQNPYSVFHNEAGYTTATDPAVMNDLTSLGCCGGSPYTRSYVLLVFCTFSHFAVAMIRIAKTTKMTPANPRRYCSTVNGMNLDGKGTIATADTSHAITRTIKMRAAQQVLFTGLKPAPQCVQVIREQPMALEFLP